MFTLLTYAAPTNAQTLALDTPTDPRSVAMGECFVAVPGTPAALMYNPAGLARVLGAALSVAERQYNWISWSDEMRFRSAALTVRTPFATLGASYQQEYYGDYPLTTESFPDGFLSTGKLYDHLLTLGAGLSLNEQWDIGAAAKIFTRSYSRTEGGNVGLETTPAYLLDLGVMYRLVREASDRADFEVFTAGISVQNIGTKLKSRLSGSGLDGQSTSAGGISMPRYLRAGVSFSITQPSRVRAALVPFQFMLVGGIRHLLNSRAIRGASGLGGGLGADALIYELLSIRLGLITVPDNYAYGSNGAWSFRYGLGVNLPLRLVGLNSPLALQGDYAAIPVNNEIAFSSLQLLPTIRSTLRAFSVGLRYEGDLF